MNIRDDWTKSRNSARLAFAALCGRQRIYTRDLRETGFSLNPILDINLNYFAPQNVTIAINEVYDCAIDTGLQLYIQRYVYLFIVVHAYVYGVPC